MRSWVRRTTRFRLCPHPPKGAEWKEVRKNSPEARTCSRTHRCYDNSNTCGNLQPLYQEHQKYSTVPANLIVALSHLLIYSSAHPFSYPSRHLPPLTTHDDDYDDMRNDQGKDCSPYDYRLFFLNPYCIAFDLFLSMRCF